MKKFSFSIGFLAILTLCMAIFFVLKSENALLTHPKGIIAQSELKLMTTNVILMLILAIPTLIILGMIIWKYREKSKKSQFDPEHSGGLFKQLLLWIIPSIVIAIMAPITWKATHKLDPYRPLESDVKPLTIQVVALDWKWLFIYPEQGIATINFVQFPKQTPIKFTLTADGSPMNGFWIPQLSGQIYCMTGMITTLHMMANDIGEFSGRAAEINGKGFSDMTFVVKSSTETDFDNWVASVKHSSLQLTDEVYEKLEEPSANNPITLYANVRKNLFHDIVMKYMSPSG